MYEDKGCLSTGGKITVGVIIGMFLLVPTLAVLLPARPLGLEGEEVRCKDMRDSTFLDAGIDGACRYYVGSDGETHYKYVQYVEGEDGMVEKDIYIIWETRKGGKY